MSNSLLSASLSKTSTPVQTCLVQHYVKPRRYLSLLKTFGGVGVAVGVAGVEPWETALLQKKKRRLSQNGIKNR